MREKAGIKVQRDYIKRYLGYSMADWAPHVADIENVLKQLLAEFQGEDG